MFTVAWFQPSANFKAIAAMGHSAVAGPEIPGGSSETFSQWAEAAKSNGLSVILKFATAQVPTNCVGLMFKDDEVNEPKGAGWPKTAAMLQAEYDALAAVAPNLPIFLTLGGDKVIYDGFPGPADKAYYLDLAAMGERLVFAVDFYSCNRSSKYPMSHPALAVSNLKKLTGKPVHAILEANDQQLNAPNPPPGAPPETNGAPTIFQIAQQFSACVSAKMDGLWWFYTCQKGKYGWTPPGSWLPPVDRAGRSMAPQYDQVRACNVALSPTPPVLTVEQRLAALEAWRARVQEK